MWRTTHAHACSPFLGWAKGVGARHVREWSAKIWLLALWWRGFLVSFYFLVAWLLSLEPYPITIRIWAVIGARVYRFVDNLYIGSRVLIGPWTWPYIRRLLGSAKPIAFEIMHRERANKFFVKRSHMTARDLVVDPAASTSSTLLLRRCRPCCFHQRRLLVCLISTHHLIWPHISVYLFGTGVLYLYNYAIR